MSCFGGPANAGLPPIVREIAMLAFMTSEHGRETLRLGGGMVLTVRSVQPDDADALQAYFRSLSMASRYSRMLGAASELPAGELAKVLHGDADHASLIATAMIDGREHIVAEARIAHDPDAETVEIGLSVDDRWQGHGIGGALFDHLQSRAASFGVVDLFGDTLRSNDAMLGLARRAGFALVPTPGDWRLVRFHKHIDAQPQNIPGANWRKRAAEPRSMGNTSARRP